jgi:hypothetical protein
MGELKDFKAKKESLVKAGLTKEEASLILNIRGAEAVTQGFETGPLLYKLNCGWELAYVSEFGKDTTIPHLLGPSKDKDLEFLREEVSIQNDIQDCLVELQRLSRELHELRMRGTATPMDDFEEKLDRVARMITFKEEAEHSPSLDNLGILWVSDDNSWGIYKESSGAVKLRNMLTETNITAIKISGLLVYSGLANVPKEVEDKLSEYLEDI